MKKFEIDSGGNPSTIRGRLVYLRNLRQMTLSEVAVLFNVNKTTVLRWETDAYWDTHDTPNKRLILMQLAELYQSDYEWILHGRPREEGKNYGILVIDDNETSLSIMTLIIRSCLSSKYKLYNFTSPEKALLWATVNPAALVFCDYRMPDMKGDEFIGKLRHLPGYNNTPVFVITQVREPGVPDIVLSAGATHVLQKPINRDHLKELLEDYRHAVEVNDQAV